MPIQFKKNQLSLDILLLKTDILSNIMKIYVPSRAIVFS